ncbi:alcohol dehydrogenase [Kibdelosporangium aridum]|uniref:alcohol dehydrogenase n=1 Tax=Kibdelosporangium aridum TaxID=2030 RepID=A0A428YR78_KIBAR|nr:zinc-binding dehydrogenase [Kibdelosporangium aridum]RSM71561.1 alcohol dehydrogenase [Kibdelosporangium aridum]
MRAWRLTTRGEPLELVDLSDPAPGPGEVVLRTMAAGLCLTDVHLADGSLPWGPLPVVLGHEVAGVITETGPEVTDFQPGDRVAVRTGPDGPGVAYDGGFGTVVRTQTERLVKIPDGVTFDQAAVATDAGLTSYHALHNKGNIQPGMKVGIVSIGGLGSFGVQIAAAAGAEVTAVVRKEALAPTALELGATTVVQSIDDVHDLDLIVDFVGSGETVRGSVLGVRHSGRVVVVGGQDEAASIPVMMLIMNNVEIVGSNAGTNDELRQVLAMIADGSLKPLLTGIGFEEIPASLDRLGKGGIAGRFVADMSTA